MQNNQQITSVSQKNDQQSRPGAEHEESVQSQSISSQSTPGQQTAFCDLSARQENEFLSKGSSIRRFVKNPNAKRPFAVDSFATTTPPDPNNNNEGAKVRSGGESPVSRVAAEHQPVYRSLSMEPAGAAQAANLPEDLVAENLQQQATAGQANSLPTIQLSSEAEHDQENASQLPVKLNYRKSSDSTHKRTKSATKKATRNLLLNKEKLEEVNSKINRTRSFNTPKKHTKSSAALAKSHVSKHNQTSSRSSSIDSNLHIQVTDSSPKTIQQQLERQFEKRARSKESRCKHHRHRKSSARQLQYPDGHAAAVSPVAGLLSYSRSTEDVRGCNCSHSELPPAVYLSNNGALVYTSGCFSSTSALAVDSFASAAGLQLHHSPISANASLVPTSFLLLPDSSVCKNVSLSPSPTYFSSYSAVPSYQTTPVHKHKHRSSSKGTKSSKKAAVSPIPDYLAVDFLEGRLTKSNSVRLSRADSKGKCSKEHRCRKCRRKTSLNSSLRGQANYAEVADGAGKHYALPTAYSPGSQLQNAGKSSSSSGGGGSGFAQPAMHMTDPLAGAVTNPILLHNPLHLHSVVHSAAAHDPITKTSSLNPAALGHIVSPVHLCQLNNALLANNLAATAGGLTPVNPLLGQLSQLTNTPSTLSVPDLSRLALNVTTATQPIQLQYTHMHPIPTTVSQQPTGDAKVSEAFTKLYRNKPAPDYFSNLFSAKPDNDRSNEKPKLLDFLLTGADDLGKFLSKSSQLDNESFSLDKNLKADANRKSSSTESLNLKTTTNATSTLTTSTTTTTILNDALKQPAVIRKNFFKEKQKGAADVKQPEKQAETANDKEANDKRQSEPNSTKGATDQDRSRPGLASGTSVASEDQSEQDKVPSKPLMEKRKTSNRHPMLNLLRKAQQTAEADAPPSFEPANSLTPNDGVQDSNKAVSRLAAVVDAEKPDHPNAVTDRTKQEVVKVEIECNKTKAKFITKQSSTERSTVASEPAVVASSEIVMHSEQPEQQPARSRPFLMRMLASRKETKQLPTTSKSLEQPSVKASIKKAAEHHTVDIPTQEEIAESTDELRALRTNLKKSGSITNGSKIGTLTRGAPKSSPSKEETGAATSTMAKLRKKATSGLAVRFAKLTHYASVDSDSPTDNAATTSTKSHVATISGRLSSLTGRSISLDKHDGGKRSLANFKHGGASTSIGSSSTTFNPMNRHRYSVTTENQPKMTDLRKILHPEEEHRDLETVCKSFWDSFIDCQCIDCTFNNAAKFITAFVIFLTVALIINTITVSSGGSSKPKLASNVSISLNLTSLSNSTGLRTGKLKLEPKIRFLAKPPESAHQIQTNLNQLNDRLERSFQEDLTKFERVKRLIKLKNELKSQPTKLKKPKVNKPIFLKDSSPPFLNLQPGYKSLKIKQAPSR